MPLRTIPLTLQMKQPNFLTDLRKKMEKAIIFDLDGTLWDSTGEVYKAWNLIFSKHSAGISVAAEDCSQFMGKTLSQIADLLLPFLDEKTRYAVMDECGQEEVRFLSRNGAVLYPDLKPVLQNLSADYSLFIVSNCQTGYLESFLSYYSFHHLFRDYEYSGRTGKSKGENIRLLMSRNHIENAVYVGDTDMDESAAREAEIPFIYAEYGFGSASSPDAVIKAFSELPAAASGFFPK